jgi:HAD superfamily hydrolase (TIGR01457 family)
MVPLSKKIEEHIKKTRLFLLDLDGTMYLGKKLIPGAKRFIMLLREQGIHYVFLTNNSSRSASDYFRKLTGLGVPVTTDNIFTSGQATGMYLSGKKRNSRGNSRVYVVGTRSLAQELATYGLDVSDGKGVVDYVVVGFDTELTYNKIRTACELIDRGVRYIATNPDFVCPIGERRNLPDCGSICFMIEQATGEKPYIIGKPRPDMVTLSRKKFQVTPGETAVIGDRLYTDIAMGRNAGVFTICVLSGESSLKDIKQSPVKPDCTIESIKELNRFFER